MVSVKEILKGVRCAWLPAGAAALALAAIAPALVWSQDNEAGTAHLAQAERTYEFDIPSKPLPRAMADFSAITGLQMLYTETSAYDHTAPALRGVSTARQALDRLTAGSGLSYRYTSANAVTLERELAQEDGSSIQSAPMAPIMIEGAAESGATSPEGFRAHNSTAATNVDALLIETPATVNVIADGFIKTIGARRIEDILQYVPGASAESVKASGTAFNIRGFSTWVFGGGASGEGSVQIDNYRTAARRYHFDPALYERIDVLKGAAALLYGTADPGGVVRYVSKKPQFERRRCFEATLGSFETMRGTLDLTGPLGTGDQAAYRLIATGLNSNQSFHGGNDDISFDDRRIINPQLAWRTPGGGELNLSYEYSKHKSTLDPGIKRLANGTFTFNTRPFLGPDSFLDRAHHIGVAEFTQPIANNWEILVGGKMGRSRLDYLSDEGSGLPDANNRLNRSTSRSNGRLQHEEIRAQLAGQFNTGALLQHQVTVGIYHLSTGVNVDRAQVLQRGVVSALNPVFGAAPALGRPTPHFSTALEEQAVYLQDYISVGEKLKIFGGLRYTDARADITLRSRRRPGADTALDYTIGAIYNLQARFNPFFSYATALTPQTGALSGGGAVPFREGRQIEAGVKSEWLGGRLATTTSIFQIEQTNIAEGDPANPGFAILAGDQRTRGFEFEAAGDITSQISLLGGYSYLDAEFVAGRNQGNRPHSVPRHKVSLFGQYEFAGDLAGWRAGLGFIHVGERQGNYANRFKLPTYERVDAFIGYERGGFDLRLAIENALNEDYVSGGNGFGDFIQGAPQFFTLSMGYDF